MVPIRFEFEQSTFTISLALYWPADLDDIAQVAEFDSAVHLNTLLNSARKPTLDLHGNTALRHTRIDSHHFTCGDLDPLEELHGDNLTRLHLLYQRRGK